MANTFIINPGLQKPHCSAPPFARKLPEFLCFSLHSFHRHYFFHQYEQPMWNMKESVCLQQHCTKSTVCSFATSFGRCNILFLSKINQQHSRLDFFLSVNSVQPETNIHSSSRALSELTAIREKPGRSTCHDEKQRRTLGKPACAYVRNQTRHRLAAIGRVQQQSLLRAISDSASRMVSVGMP